MTYSKKISEIRQSFGMNMRDFGTKVGLNFSTISLLEKGYRGKAKTPIIPLIDTLKQICDRTNYPFRQFLEEAGYIEPSAVQESSAIERLFNELSATSQNDLISQACGRLYAEKGILLDVMALQKGIYKKA